MKTNYRGFEIEANRETSLGGSSNIYYTVMRIDDGWFLADGFYETEDTINEFVNDLKLIVDDYYENPSEYEEYEDESHQAVQVTTNVFMSTW